MAQAIKHLEALTGKDFTPKLDFRKEGKVPSYKPCVPERFGDIGVFKGNLFQCSLNAFFPLTEFPCLSDGRSQGRSSIPEHKTDHPDHGRKEETKPPEHDILQPSNTTIDLFKPLVNLFKPFFDLFKPFFDLPKSAVNLIKSFVHLLNLRLNPYYPIPVFQRIRNILGEGIRQQ